MLSVNFCSYYNKAVGALLVYDITDHCTFRDSTKWLQELRQHANKDIVIILVGNKVDMKHLRVVHYEEGNMFAGNVVKSISGKKTLKNYN